MNSLVMSRGKTVFVWRRTPKRPREKFRTGNGRLVLSAAFSFVAEAPLRKNVAATLDRSDGCKAEANGKNTEHNEIDEHARANA